ncbi:hypothetical protein N7G274_007795 [Stereocaulon virgatum]|uniref:DNA-directed DNA polymerase n=1 Tax=Stereocaulon virgatum TaxID=373712 RepID=A0ABR4A1L9_9LECA
MVAEVLLAECLTVLYGDTDSVMVSTPDSKTDATFAVSNALDCLHSKMSRTSLSMMRMQIENRKDERNLSKERNIRWGWGLCNRTSNAPSRHCSCIERATRLSKLKTEQGVYHVLDSISGVEEEHNDAYNKAGICDGSGKMFSQAKNFRSIKILDEVEVSGDRHVSRVMNYTQKSLLFQTGPWRWFSISCWSLKFSDVITATLRTSPTMKVESAT